MNNCQSLTDTINSLKTHAAFTEKRAEKLRDAVATLQQHPELWEVIKFLTDPGYKYE